MSQELAIIAGQGQLPRELAKACPGALYVTFEGASDVEVPQGRHLSVRLEHLGALFDRMREDRIKKVVFAGKITRQDLDPAAFDIVGREVWPRLIQAMGKGDAGLLSEIIAVFEEQGFEIIGAHEAAPALLAAPEMTCGGKMDTHADADAARGLEALATLSPLDMGQGVVVEGGLVLGVETLQGTDAMLEYVAATPKELRRGRGVFVKTAKAGQDLRADMPAIGPETIRLVAAAGLAGLFIEAGRVLVLDRGEVARLVDALGLSLVVR